MDEKRMTKGERDDLIRLIKQRERVAKSAAAQRSAAMLAEFEEKISATHSFATNEIWKAAAEAAIDAAKKANEEIKAEAERLGIPDEFKPSLTFVWERRGENEYQSRRDELRRVAKAEIEVLERYAKVQIESESVKAQTEIISNGLSTDAAVDFLNKLPAPESMMPTLDITDIQKKLTDRARRRSGYQGPQLIDQ